MPPQQQQQQYPNGGLQQQQQHLGNVMGLNFGGRGVEPIDLLKVNNIYRAVFPGESMCCIFLKCVYLEAVKAIALLLLQNRHILPPTGLPAPPK